MSALKYMILDNDCLSSALLESILEIVGEGAYQIFTSPSTLLEALSSSKPDIVFCNVTARGCDPRVLCKNKEIDVPFVFISVLEKQEERRQCYLDSGFPYITSPISPQLIKNLL